VVSAIVFSEGATVDARTAKGRADSFISSELYELYHLLSDNGTRADAEKIRKISFEVELDESSQDISSLFRPSGDLHVLAYTPGKIRISGSGMFRPELHYVETFDAAEKTIDEYDIGYMLFDIFAGAENVEKEYLNWEDVQTEERSFLNDFMTRYPNIPVFLLESKDKQLTEVEKISYLRNGVRGFINADAEDLTGEIEELGKEVFQQNCMSRLARSNVLLEYETSQQTDAENKEAKIRLFDLKLEKAIKGEDAENIMSLLSTPDEKFDDVIGADDAKNELRYFVSYMKDPKSFRRKGVSAPKGILLYGPPGTGKTMLAKAFAAEAGATFIAAEGNQFAKKYIGEGPELVHRLFSIARRYAPSILFVDEIDTIARKRTGNDTDASRESENVLTAFFAEMDGFSTDTDKPVFVLGATNYQVDGNSAMSLDPAMLRRFDRSILVDLPDKENRKTYLRNRISETPIFSISEAEIENLADRSTGMSIALLSSMLDMAIRTAVQKGYEVINDEVLDDVLETFKNGEEHDWSPEVTLRTARHESGHTLVSWILGEKPSFVTISSRGDFGGYMQFADREQQLGFTKKELLNRVKAALAGRAAEIVYYGSEEGISTGAAGDLATATDIVTKMLSVYGMYEDFGMAAVSTADGKPGAEVIDRTNKILSELMAETVGIVSVNREAIDSMVEQLLATNSMNAEAIDRLFNNSVTKTKEEQQE
jgi:ATP-dependent Zn protease